MLDDPVHNTQELVKSFLGLGADVLCYDYSGYGASTGERGERVWISDCATAFAYAEEHLGWPRHKIIAAGQSVGTGVVLQYLRSERGYAGLMLFHPYRSIVATQSVFLARYVLRLLDLFRSEDVIDEVEGPVLVAHAIEDQVRCKMAPGGAARWRLIVPPIPSRTRCAAPDSSCLLVAPCDASWRRKLQVPTRSRRKPKDRMCALTAPCLRRQCRTTMAHTLQSGLRGAARCSNPRRCPSPIPSTRIV